MRSSNEIVLVVPGVRMRVLAMIHNIKIKHKSLTAKATVLSSSHQYLPPFHPRCTDTTLGDDFAVDPYIWTTSPNTAGDALRFVWDIK